MGGSIPFLAELGRQYPETYIIPMGVLGPHSNAHGPNEMIDLAYTKKLVCCLSHIVGAIGQQ
jgi:acetylornithine deacetylase/succinyl-diaminopimelate desuccinylase-like protein